MNTVYLQTYFVTIASVIGTSILGLPLTLYNSGLYPFIVVFIVAFVMEALVVIISVEILQKARAVQVIPYNKAELNRMIDEDTSYDEQENQPENSSLLSSSALPSKEKGIRPPDMHLLAQMFLCNGIRHVFDILSIFDMMNLLTAYLLAGSEAYSEMLGIKYLYMIAVFCWSLALLIVFAFKLIQPVVSILTFISASLFTMVVIVTFFVIWDVHENIQNNFNYIQDSFLVSVVSLGGSIFVMPFLFRKIENDASQIKKYRFAVVMGLVTCTILNILWCWAVIEIVPQHCTTMEGTNQSSHSPITCNSLESAKENGEISTKPLTSIIHHKYPSFLWVAKAVEVFILISITVSFMTIGTATHDIICGIVESNLPTYFSSKCTEKSKHKENIGKKCVSSVLSLIVFGIIFIVSMLNPKGFFDIIEKYESSVANIQNFFVVVMFLTTKYKESNKVKIPLPLPNMMMPFIFLLPLYYGFGIGYDIYYSVMSYLDHKTDPILPELQHLHHNSSF